MTIEDLEPCRFFNVGMVVWVSVRLKEGPAYIAAKVIEAHGYSAYVENEHRNYASWIDLRHIDVMIKKLKKENDNGTSWNV